MTSINPVTEARNFSRVIRVDIAALNNGTGVSATGTTTLMPLAGLLVTAVEHRVVTPSDAALLTCDVGDGTTATRFLANADCKGAAGTVTVSTAANASFGAASTANLVVTWDHTATNGVVEFIVYGYVRP